MKTLMDFVNDTLPEGATVKRLKELSNCFRFQFCYSGYLTQGEIPKATSPGCEKKLALRTVATCMSKICLEAGDTTRAHDWLEVALTGKMQ